MSRFFSCTGTKLLSRFQVKFVRSYVLYSDTTLSRIFPSVFYNIRKKLEKPSPICHKRPLHITVKYGKIVTESQGRQQRSGIGLLNVSIIQIVATLQFFAF